MNKFVKKCRRMRLSKNEDEHRHAHEQRHHQEQAHQEISLENRNGEPLLKRRKSSNPWPTKSIKQHRTKTRSSPETISLKFKRRVSQNFLAKLETDSILASQDSNTKSKPDLPSRLHTVPSPADTSTVHNQLFELTEKLYAASHQTSQWPSPFRKPYVHAMTRQALYETLPYFRSAQGGSYSTDALFRGFMLIKKPTILITLTKTLSFLGLLAKWRKGKNGSQKEMIENSQIRSLKRNKRSFNSVITIVAEENPILQFYSNTYNVLDFFPSRTSVLQPHLQWITKSVTINSWALTLPYFISTKMRESKRKRMDLTIRSLCARDWPWAPTAV